MIQKILHYIEAHLHEDLSLEALAQYAGFSKFHFQRLFQKEMGVSASEYVRYRRITHAAHRLLHTNERIIDIALALRFETQESFTRSFRKLYKLPPGQFRKQMKKTIIMEERSFMHPTIQHVIQQTNTKFGLENYILKTERLERSHNIFGETFYKLSMEWFPSHTPDLDEDECNPEGTVCIDINLHTGRYEKVIFVHGKTFATGVSFDPTNIDAKIRWIENETGLTYGKHFMIQKEENDSLLFKECFKTTAVSPSGLIELNHDENGQLMLFTIYGQFLGTELIEEESYSLTLDAIGQQAKEQFKLMEFPSLDQKKLTFVYGIEEIYITNDQTATLPYQFFVDDRMSIQIEQLLSWESPLQSTFKEQPISFTEEVTLKQALTNEPHPDLLPISIEETEACIASVIHLLRQEYPLESNLWMLKTLHRDKGYIIATLRRSKQTQHVFQRKLTVWIDSQTLEPINYIDNSFLFETFEEYQPAEKITVTKEEVFEKLKDKLELTPYYVYDLERKKYILCGKLDCQYGVNAASGEVIELSEL